jgi:glyceraldehyde-3-phosphate dehydrogenase/erythrose-4-phosphate dehydrogenase
MTIRVGINGFGRIGMLTTKALMLSGDIEVVAVNDVMPTRASWMRCTGILAGPGQQPSP